MKRIVDVKPGQFLTSEEVIGLFPGLTKNTIYKWRSKTKLGAVDPGTYPRSIKLGSELYFIKEEVVEFINRELLKQAS